MLSERDGGRRRGLVTLVLDAPTDCDAPYMSNVWRAGLRVGETLSGAWGYRVGASLALAMLRADCLAPGTAVEVEIFGQRIPATVRGEAALWDPANQRIRA